MKLHEKPKLLARSQKRLGRGYGSGKGGHTSTRGQKGQKTRGKIPAHFVGTSWVWFKRLPFIRGKSKFKSIAQTVTISLGSLNVLKSATVVTPQALALAGLVSKQEARSGKLKIVATGTLNKKLDVQIPATNTAIEAIKAAGGVYSVQAE